MAKEQYQEEWHLSKTVNISHLVTTVILVVGMVSYIGDIETKVAVQNSQITNLKEKIKHIDESHNDMFIRIDGKLDKLFDLFVDTKE
jgi:hypothetical protein